jgi:membrane protein
MENSDSRGKRFASFFKELFKNFSRDQCVRLAAAIAYFTVFALPPFTAFLVVLMGQFVDPEQVREIVLGLAESIVGSEAAAQLQEMIGENDAIEGGSPIAVIVGIAALIFSASGAFLSLQWALNTVWHVQPDPEQGGAKKFLLKRLSSLLMVVVVAVLLMAPLLISGVIGVLGDIGDAALPGDVSAVLVQLITWVVAFALFTALFAAVFRILPDTVVAWSDVWVGALFTAFLFIAGMAGMSLYLTHADPADGFGAAGSLVLILLWIYVSALIVLIGAEFTQVWVGRKGKGVQPQDGAVRYRIELIRGARTSSVR